MWVILFLLSFCSLPCGGQRATIGARAAMTDRYSNLDSDGSFEAEYSEDYQDDDAGYGAQENDFVPDQNYKEDAKLDYKTVVILAQKTFRPRDFIRNYDSKNPGDESKWELRNGGIASLSFADGSLRLESGNREDFKEVIRQMNQKGSATGNKAEKPEYTDYIKSIKIIDMTSNWEEACVMEFKTIPAFQDDFNYSKSGNVIHTFLQGKLSSKPKNFDILQRTITKGNVALEKQFPGATHTNLESTIIPFGDDHNLVPFNGVIHAFHNLAQPENKKIKAPIASLGSGAKNVIELTKSQTDAALEAARKELGNTVSRGDVTNNFRVTIAAQPNSIREAQHQKWKDTKKAEGKEWRGFADAFNVLPKGTEADRASFMENHYDFSCKFVIEYLKQT